METIAKYLEAIEEINVAQGELDRIVKAARMVASTLPDHWATLSVLGIKEPFIPEIPADQPRSAISSSQWPTLGRIAHALSHMHRAYDAAQAAWANIEPEYRERLAPPPERFCDDQSALAGGEGGDIHGKRRAEHPLS